MIAKSLIYETRRVRDVSLRISAISRTEYNSVNFTAELLVLLRELKRDNTPDLSDIRAFIKGVKQTYYAMEDQMDDTMKYSFRKAVVGARIKEQRFITVG